MRNQSKHPVFPPRGHRFTKRLTSLVLIVASIAAPVLGDDFDRLDALFALSHERGGVITIPPGDYELEGQKPLPLASNLTINAYGA